MNYIYKIEREDEVDYDQYDALVVCAESQTQALMIHPNGPNGWEYTYSWLRTSPKKITLLGVAEPGLKQGIILASFNAG